MKRGGFRMGVLGGGQLGRMLGLAAYPLGITPRFYDPSSAAGAGRVGELTVGEYEDLASLDRFADGCDVVTYEFENVPLAPAQRLKARGPLDPAPAALAAAQDRLNEKRLFRQLGLSTAEFVAIDGERDIEAAFHRLPAPLLLKTRRWGYDGKGQRPVSTRAEALKAWRELGERPLLAEGLVPFSRELSSVAVRARNGEVHVYPPVENRHREGILRLSLAPAGVSPELLTELEAGVRALLDALGYVGVVAIEWFALADRVLANEFAPRVHNSGHWTIEGAETSQFENHVRAVCGLPLGATACRGSSAMVNLIGELPEPKTILESEGAHLHLYDKSPRPGRKLGHVTVIGATLAERDARLEELLARVPTLRESIG